MPRLCNPIGNRNFQTETKQNITTERTPHSTFLSSGLISVHLCLPNIEKRGMMKMDGFLAMHEVMSQMREVLLVS